MVRRGARHMTGSLLRARQRALTALSPHNANDTHFIPNRSSTGVGGGISVPVTARATVTGAIRCTEAGETRVTDA